MRNALCSAAGCGNNDQWWRAEEILTGRFFLFFVKRFFFVGSIFGALLAWWQLKHFVGSFHPSNGEMIQCDGVEKLVEPGDPGGVERVVVKT